MASELLESDKLNMSLLLQGTQIDNNQYIKKLETAIELITYTGEQIFNPFMHNVVKWPNIL